MKNTLRNMYDMIVIFMCVIGASLGFVFGVLSGLELNIIKTVACVILSFILLFIGSYYSNLLDEVWYDYDYEDEEA